jgi:hypothetical protein
MLVTAGFETASEKYHWLNRIVSVALGHRIAGGAIYHVFEILQSPPRRILMRFSSHVVAILLIAGVSSIAEAQTAPAARRMLLSRAAADHFHAATTAYRLFVPTG